jgi:hypothetical protein
LIDLNQCKIISRILKEPLITEDGVDLKQLDALIKAKGDAVSVFPALVDEVEQTREENVQKEAEIQQMAKIIKEQFNLEIPRLTKPQKIILPRCGDVKILRTAIETLDKMTLQEGSAISGEHIDVLRDYLSIAEKRYKPKDSAESEVSEAPAQSKVPKASAEAEDPQVSHSRRLRRVRRVNDGLSRT